MDNLFLLLLLASLVLFVIGLFSPATSLFWDKKAYTKKKSAIVYGALIIICFMLFGITSDTKKNLEVSKNEVSEHGLIKDVPSYKNIDSLITAFSSAPFNYTFQNENAFSDTNATIKGFESPDITDATTNNHILLQFDPETKEIYLADLTIIVDDYNIKPRQVEQIFKFAQYFDPQSERYFRRHFKDIFYNNKTYLDSSGYTSEQKGLDLVINHNLLEAKEFVQREGKSSLAGHSLDVTIEVSNKAKAKSLFK